MLILRHSTPEQARVRTAIAVALIRRLLLLMDNHQGQMDEFGQDNIKHQRSQRLRPALGPQLPPMGLHPLYNPNILLQVTRKIGG
jgi:hypothetical protein